MRARHHLILLILLIITSSLKGQDISVVADYPTVVRVGEQFTISFTINSGGGEFSAPSFDGFYKLMGPQTSYSSSTQIINGKITRETNYSYVYYLQAVKTGKFVLAPAEFVYKNKTYRSDSIYIEVVGSGTSQQPGRTTTPGTGKVENADEPVRETGDDIFLNLILNKKDVFVGEHILATVKLYTKVDISGINEIKFPRFEGFLRTDLNTPPLTSLKREYVNGTLYGTGIVQQFILYPQRAGEIEIDPVQITALVQQRTRQSDPFFGDFFSTFTTVPKAVFSPVTKVNVRPLPGNKPPDFSGIVGKVSLNASLDKDSVKVNDAVTLKIILSGTGNLKLANPPEMKLPADIEVYDPKISDDLKSGSEGTSGEKTFEYLLIPRHYGDYTIPPLTYSYFDIQSRQYQKITLPALSFHASKGDEQSSGITVYGGVAKEDVKYLGKDIRFIQQKPGNLKKSGNILFKKRSYYTSFLIALIVFLAILVGRREHIRRNSDISMVRNRKAAKVAGRRLKEASACLNNGITDRFYDEILKAIWGYLSDKLGIPPSDLTRQNAISALNELGIGQEHIDRLNAVLDACEFARYAPASTDKEATGIYEDASKFISSVENSII